MAGGAVGAAQNVSAFASLINSSVKSVALFGAIGNSGYQLEHKQSSPEIKRLLLGLCAPKVNTIITEAECVKGLAAVLRFNGESVGNKDAFGTLQFDDDTDKAGYCIGLQFFEESIASADQVSQLIDAKIPFLPEDVKAVLNK